jgi:hypothetical protein
MIVGAIANFSNDDWLIDGDEIDLPNTIDGQKSKICFTIVAPRG